MAVADKNASNHFKCFIDTIYAFFGQSTKYLNKLKRVASTLSVQLTKIGRVLDSR
jgi:hypothetical protein